MSSNRKHRYQFFWARVLCFPILPAIVVSIQYDLLYFKEYSGLKVTLFGSIIIGSVVLIFWKHLTGWIQTWQPSLGKSFLDIMIRMIPIIIFTGLLMGFSNNVGNIVQIWWVIVGGYTASILFKQGHDTYLIADVETEKNRRYR